MFPFTSQYYMQQCLTEMSYLNSFNSCFYSPSQVYYMASPTQILNYDLPPNKISELYEQTQSPLSGSERLEEQLMENSSSSISNENEILREVRRQKKVCRVKEEAKQKFGRNICSNIFHLMVKFVKKQKKMKAMVGKIIQQNKMSIKTNQFYQFFKNKCYKLKSYANFAKIEQFWKGINISPSQSNSKNQKQIECAKIFRILGRVYLHYHHFPYVYNSLKIKGESKRLHTEGLRRILSL